MKPEEAMFNEAMSAVQKGERARARDLLTRLLKVRQNNASYWLWMSAVVDTPKERVYCLNEVLRLEPENVEARRGLQLMGLLPPDENQVIPLRAQKHNWQSALFAGEEPEKLAAAQTWRQAAVIAVGAVVVIALVVVGILGTRQVRQKAFVLPAGITLPPTHTFTPSATAAVRTPTTTFVGPTPLWMQLKQTYTPTPLYVSTPHPRSEAFQIGMRAYQREDWPGVYRYMQQVITIEPDAPDVFYYAGEALRLQKKFNEALTHYNTAIQLNPLFGPAYVGRARAILQQNPKNSAQAVTDLQTAIQNDPKMLDPYLELVELALKDKNYIKASALLDKAAALAPDSPLVVLYYGQIDLAQGKFSQALEAARKANTLDFTLLPAYKLLGQALFASDKQVDAIEPLQTYTIYVKDDVDALVLLSTAYEANQNMDQALQVINSALTVSPNSAELLARRGRIFLQRQEYETALQDFKTAYRLDAQSFEASMGEGEALYLSKFPGDAYMQFERTVSLADTDARMAELLYWRARSLEDLDKSEVALQDWKALLALPVDSVRPEWVKYAQSRVKALSTATPTPLPGTPTPTFTRTVTRTFTPTVSSTR